MWMPGGHSRQSHRKDEGGGVGGREETGTRMPGGHSRQSPREGRRGEVEEKCSVGRMHDM